ncbi:MAG: PD-(D/E)XK nuclease family protein [Proteobacteria bacterium]|nr:PD-(D/E)XK nuclease family protein [Pseudomonadota bacterium]
MVGVYTIPSGYSFLENLAKGLLHLSKDNPFSLAQMEIFLPTRRACLELSNALSRQNQGHCILLPRLSPLGDLDEDLEWVSFPQDEVHLNTLIPPFKRLGLLTNLIEEYTNQTDLPSSPLLSLKLAKSLVRLMDQAAIENVPWENLAHLVPSEFANHWQLTLHFLEIITTHWPRILEEKSLLEPYTRHHLLVERMLARWKKTPPQHPIIAAGSTGTMPATARLLQAIASLPQGNVILPGLETTLDDEEVHDLSPCHPQYAPVRFLQKVNLLPSEIPVWPNLEKPSKNSIARARLFSEAQKSSFSLNSISPEKALEGVTFIPCASPQEEALAISVLFRQQLETPHQKIALITSDLKLAERVTWELKRWGIEIDSSSGDALDQTPPAVFLILCAEFAASPHDKVALLSLLKHPLFFLQRPAGTLRSKIRQFEKHVLREGARSSESPWFADFQRLIRPLKRIEGASFVEILNHHLKIAEALSMNENGICQLWKGAKGEATKDFFDELIKTAESFPPLTLGEYPSLLKELFQGQSIRFRPQKHPRLAILGPIEARLFHADVMILGGLNDGTWPPMIDVDPWLNRPMRQEMGFPSPERRIGLSAHDFGQAFSSQKVYLTRALKVDGTPTLACRWLARLEVYLKAWNLSLPEEPHILEWTQQLDRPLQQDIRLSPLPTPPLKTRPRRLSVTQIETWMRDPYALYARHILALSSLDSLNNEIQASDKGTFIHQVLDQFFKICPDPHRKDALDTLLFIGKTLFEPYEHDSAAKLFWWPRFHNLAHWFIAYERSTRLRGTQTFTEVKGTLVLETPQGSFECTAKADRIDLLPDGRLHILDYKTGTPPSDQDVQFGFAPQLPLEGAIALKQGFEGITSTELESLQFWQLKGDRKGGQIKTLSGDPHETSLKALLGLERIIHLFENEQTPYPANPLPIKGLKYNDYAHLARLQEWGKM